MGKSVSPPDCKPGVSDAVGSIPAWTTKLEPAGEIDITLGFDPRVRGL